MSDVTRADIARIAALARLEIDEEALTKLVPQMQQILEYVSRLDAIDTGEEPPGYPWLSAPIQPLRPDEVRPPSLHGRLGDLAPAFRDGFFLVPRLEGMDDA